MRKKTNEEFLKELQEKNSGIVPLEPYKGASIPILCRCTCGNEWPVSPANLMLGKKCRKCMGKRSSERQLMSNEEFLRILSEVNTTIEPLEDYKGKNTHIQFRCKICGSIWPTMPRQVLKGRGCRSCQNRWQTSFPEQALFYYIRKEFLDAVNGYTDGFYPSELDIYIPSKKVGIEYDGRTHHSKVSKTEITKYNTCKERGIFLIRVRERVEAVHQGQICDLLICSEYGDKKLYSSLDECIGKVLDYLQISEDIDVERDEVDIKEQYYSIIKANSLGAKYPVIAKEWDYSKNGTMTPYMIMPKSGDEFYWICPQCGRSYPAKVYTRTAGHGCSDCAGVSKKDQEQFVAEITERWPDIEVLGEYVNADTDILFRCRKCGKEFKTSPHSILSKRRGGNGCTECSRKMFALSRALPEEEFLKRVEEKNPNIEVIGKYVNSHEPIECRCRKCGNTWTPKTASTLYLGTTGCAKCARNKPVRILCVETGEVFDSLSKAEKEKGVGHSSLSKCINGKGKTAGGFHWRKLDD